MRAPLNLPPKIAQQFVEDMRAYLIEPNGHKRDEIAARQLSVLRSYQGPREKKVTLSEVKEMFERMREYLKD